MASTALNLFRWPAATFVFAIGISTFLLSTYCGSLVRCTWRHITFRLAWKVARGQAAARHRNKAHRRTALYCLTLTERRSLTFFSAFYVMVLADLYQFCLLCLLFFLVLLWTRNGWAIVAGMVSCMIMLILASLQWDADEMLDAADRCTPKWIQRFFPHTEALQEWSEVWCPLSVHAQKRQRYPFLMILGLSALVFGCFRYPAVTVGCVVHALCCFPSHDCCTHGRDDRMALGFCGVSSGDYPFEFCGNIHCQECFCRCCGGFANVWANFAASTQAIYYIYCTLFSFEILWPIKVLLALAVWPEPNVQKAEMFCYQSGRGIHGSIERDPG